ncbi:MAG: hypothetical protein M3460_02470 [Actinomycetota bacterium]|nr:hypothetical protein [Actinomycetota bacterium]
MRKQPTEVRTCGRPTRSGKPRQARIYGFGFACGMHASQHDRELAEVYRRGHGEGFQSGLEMGAGTVKQNVERLERRIQELEQRLDDAARIYEINGDQVIQVGRYAYRWRGDMPLAVGTRVLLPENWVSCMKDGPGPYEGVVTQLGTTYRGELSVIVGRAPAEGM